MGEKRGSLLSTGSGRDRDNKAVSCWSCAEVGTYLRGQGHPEEYVRRLTEEEGVDGKALLLLREEDLKGPPIRVKGLGDLKRLLSDILSLQGKSQISAYRRGRRGRSRRGRHYSSSTASSTNSGTDEEEEEENAEETSEEESSRGLPHLLLGAGEERRASNLKPEVFKAIVAMLYLFVVTWITALVMVIVHDRVPDMEKYPPLPDLFLDNMPHIPWAFEMCEVTGTILLFLWAGVLFFHKHRFILIRRFFALSGTVFLLRCFTMLITSLSVPGAHLKCNPRPYGDWMSKLYNAYLIWKGAGMSIQGVRTCGDYMFSGHTVALTMLNFFVTEYTTRRLYFIHTFSWLLNTFGIFFILAAHEHYSIDVFIAFYITSRLFLYYHTLANNQALMQRDSKRTKVWFPLFSYFESGVDGIVPNVYGWPLTMRMILRWKRWLWREAKKMENWVNKVKRKRGTAAAGTADVAFASNSTSTTNLLNHNTSNSDSCSSTNSSSDKRKKKE